MKSKKLSVFIGAIIMACLLMLAYLPQDGSASIQANGTTQEKILVSIANDLWSDDTLYSLNPDGSGQTKLFDFHNHSQDTTGRIWQPRVAPDGVTIHFSSDSAYLWTPASRNLFRIASDGSWWDQITPDRYSGLWNQPGPYGVVEGTVEKSNGDPWIGASIFLEGMDLKYSEADGSFHFDNVPEGKRWIVAYEPGNSDHFDAEEIFVSSVSPWTANLVPGSDAWMEFQFPALYSNRIYHVLGLNSIQWTDVNATSHTEVYSVMGACSGIPDVDAFDVSSSGKLAIIDYWVGCAGHDGLYTADKDGGNMQLLVDMKAGGYDDHLWEDVFWSPDESWIAFKSRYVGVDTIVVYNASTGAILGWAYADTGTQILNLHGWSPDSNWLLYSAYESDMAHTTLAKVKINTDGSIDLTSIANLLTDVRLSGATWGELKSSYKIYLPALLRGQ